MQIELHGVLLNVKLPTGVLQKSGFIGSDNMSFECELNARRGLAGRFTNPDNRALVHARLEGAQDHVRVGDFEHSPSSWERAGVRLHFEREQGLVELQPSPID